MRVPSTTLALLAATGLVSAPLSSCSKKDAPGGDSQKDAGKSEKDCCKGKNECKGKGGCKTGSHSCSGKNECKGKGGCAHRDCD
jgi:hypothetical protein